MPFTSFHARERRQQPAVSVGTAEVKVAIGVNDGVGSGCGQINAVQAQCLGQLGLDLGNPLCADVSQSDAFCPALAGWQAEHAQQQLGQRCDMGGGASRTSDHGYRSQFAVEIARLAREFIDVVIPLVRVADAQQNWAGIARGDAQAVVAVGIQR